MTIKSVTDATLLEVLAKLEPCDWELAVTMVEELEDTLKLLALPRRNAL